MDNIKTFVNKLNDIENASITAKELIYENNTALDVIAKVLVSTLYSTSTANTMSDITADVATNLNDLLDSLVWAFARICNDDCIPNYILKRCEDLQKAIREEFMS